PAPTSSSSSRKRLAAEALIADSSADPRPPTKVTVTQPHGQLLRITNGVPASLSVCADEVLSSLGKPKIESHKPRLGAPTAAAPSQDKRSLRSQDGGSRLKSDLATYFSNYDEVIAGVPEESDALDLHTSIYIADEPLRPAKRARTSTPEPSRLPPTPTRSLKAITQSPARKSSTASLPSAQSSTAYQVLDYSSIASHVHDDADPLSDSVFFVPHRRAERKEKQLRNIEKERAMHEKVQLERLLDGLLGPDWLKVMGVTGVTDGERKDWEPKRDYFVKEVEALVDKFRIWKEEEKRLRAEKEAAHAAREDEESPESEESHAGTEANTPRESQEKKREKEKEKEKEPKPPQPRRPPRPHGYLLPAHPPEPTTPFTSFYSKPHLRAAALGKHRHGRNATAFGQQIPEFQEAEFEIPDEYITPEALRDHARKRRRQKRESGM
ncbi:uncharacterized protein EI97DRAFT_364746, partial [Westerdykella ornata]